MNTSTKHDTAIQACATHRDLAAFQQLTKSSLPILLGLAGGYLDKHQPSHQPDFKRSLGRPLEDWLFQRWLDDKPGSAALERQGPRTASAQRRSLPGRPVGY